MRFRLKHLSLPKQLLLGLCTLHFFFNVLWLAFNTAPLPWDQAGHTRISVRYSYYFRDMLPKIEQEANPLTISPYYPPLTHLISSTFVTIFGSHVFVAALPITLFFLLLLVGVFRLNTMLFKNEWVGLLAAFLFSLFPVIYENSRWFLLEIPMLTFLVFALILLLKSQGFTNWRYTFLFSLVAAGLLLTKWVGVIFLIVPSLFAVYSVVKERKLPQAVPNIILGGLVALTIAFPWYYLNYKTLFSIGSQAVQGEASDPQVMLSLENLLFYLHQFLNFQVTLWPSLGLLIATAAYFLTPKLKYKRLFATSLAFYYLFFTFISNKDIRYTLPILLVLVSTAAFMLVKWYREQRTGMLTTMTVCLLPLVFYYFTLSFGSIPKVQGAINLGPLGYVDYINTTDVVVHPPRRDTTPIRLLMRDIERNSGGKHVFVYIGVDQPELNPATFDLYQILGNYQISLPKLPFNKTRFESDAEIKAYLAQFNLYVLPEWEVGPAASRNRVALEQVRDYILRHHLDDFVILREYPSQAPHGKILLLKPAS